MCVAGIAAIVALALLLVCQKLALWVFSNSSGEIQFGIPVTSSEALKFEYLVVGFYLLSLPVFILLL